MADKSYSETSWYKISNPGEVSSPALLIYPERIEINIGKMIVTAGNADNLRPHVKTHKMPRVIGLQMSHGIHKFKCSTIAEAEMVAGCGAHEILLAYQPAGPNIERFFHLKERFPEIKISCLVDCEEVILQLSRTAVRAGIETSVWLDINNGMNRTGVPPGEKAFKLLKLINDSVMINAEGLHVYDGHIHEKDFSLRQKICNEAYAPVNAFLNEVKKQGNKLLSVVAGGTPTFPIHAKRAGIETSPGTLLLWDYGYSSSFPDLDFLHAAVLMTRIISKPCDDYICLDLGHKAIGSEMPHPRIKLLDLDSYDFISHNEEHLVIRTPEGHKLKIGDVLYGIPYHICSTVDRHDWANVVKDGKVVEQWDVAARKRRITI